MYSNTQRLCYVDCILRYPLVLRLREQRPSAVIVILLLPKNPEENIKDAHPFDISFTSNDDLSNILPDSENSIAFKYNMV